MEGGIYRVREAGRVTAHDSADEAVAAEAAPVRGLARQPHLESAFLGAVRRVPLRHIHANGRGVGQRAVRGRLPVGASGPRKRRVEVYGD